MQVQTPVLHGYCISLSAGMLHAADPRHCLSAVCQLYHVQRLFMPRRRCCLTFGRLRVWSDGLQLVDANRHRLLI